MQSFMHLLLFSLTPSLPVPSPWNAVLRPYRPRAEVTDGRWKMPALEAIP